MSINDNLPERYRQSDFTRRTSLYLQHRGHRPLFDQIDYREFPRNSARKASSPKARHKVFSSISLFITRRSKGLFGLDSIFGHFCFIGFDVLGCQ